MGERRHRRSNALKISNPVYAQNDRARAESAPSKGNPLIFRDENFYVELFLFIYLFIYLFICFGNEHVGETTSSEDIRHQFQALGEPQSRFRSSLFFLFF